MNCKGFAVGAELHDDIKRAETPFFSICVILLAGALSCCCLAPFQGKNGSLFLSVGEIFGLAILPAKLMWEVAKYTYFFAFPPCHSL